jgi:hypothetical protein
MFMPNLLVASNSASASVRGCSSIWCSIAASCNDSWCDNGNLGLTQSACMPSAYICTCRQSGVQVGGVLRCACMCDNSLFCACVCVVVVVQCMYGCVRTAVFATVVLVNTARRRLWFVCVCRFYVL